MSELYELLGVSSDASQDEIKRAYRKKARQFHPDANPDDAEAEAQFKQVAQAYEVLSSPEKRAQYDQFGSVDGGGAGSNGAGGNPFGAGLGDLFDAFFNPGSNMGGARGGTGTQRGVDLEVLAELDLEETVTGVAKEVSVRTAVACDTCDSSGAAPGSSVKSCDQCQGTGQVRQLRQSILGQMVTTATCSRCGGAGVTVSEPCDGCAGEGRRVEEKTYTVDIPAGVAHGSTLRLTGRGAAGPRGGVPGDLYVEVRVVDHPTFERKGDDLWADLKVAVTQATLGADVTFETIDGPEVISIPAASQAGKLFKISQKGIPKLRGRGRGDIVCRLVVETPTDLTSEQEVLIRELAQERSEEVREPGENGLFDRIKTAFS